MPRSGIHGSLSYPKLDVVVDTGNPFLNRTVDGFLKIGAVGACKVAAEETFECLHRGNVSKNKLEHAKNAMLGGALTGALFSAASNNHKDKVIKDAITGGAIATAVEFINYLT